jgi:Ran GTPase-activating protein (RanGAP) involved in mRNA processing and transport
MLLQRLEQARNSVPTMPYSCLLLSNWNLDEMAQEVLDALEVYLRHQQKILRCQQQHEIKESSENSNSNVQKQQEERLQEVILHNCTGDYYRLRDLVALILETTAQSKHSSLTIRYDKQRNLPLAIASGLLKGTRRRSCQLKSLTLKGMTLTVAATDKLRQAFHNLSSLQELTIRGNFTLLELDRKQVSIVGHRRGSDRHSLRDIEYIIDLLYEILHDLPQLLLLDLQQCHLPDEYIADILDAIHPESLCCLRLNGNMCFEESQAVLYNILTHKKCALEELDLSWQRLPKASKNCSVLHLELISSALACKNTSLQRLILSDNHLLDEDVAQLAVALQHNGALSSLQLQNCFIGPRGMLALTEHLPNYSENFKSLQVDGNQRMKKSSTLRKKLFQSLLKNVYLQQLDLPEACRSKTLEWVLELNRAGRRALTFSSCSDAEESVGSNESQGEKSSSSAFSLQDTLWPNILERADRVARQQYLMEESCTKKAASAIYLLLRERGYQALVH